MVVALKKRDVYAGNLILVNRCHAYQAQEMNEAELKSAAQTDSVLVSIEDSDIRMQKCAAVHLARLLMEIRAQSQIVPVSGWRSRKEQQQIWDDSLLEHGKVFTETYVALPGHSEHQTGLAIDVGKMQDAIDFIRPKFPYTGICQKFRERAAAYGFVERYPKGRESVTGIGHEPWHFRYVGEPHASFMAEHAMTLEEYTDFLRCFPYGQKKCRMVCQKQIFDLSFYKVPLYGEQEMDLEIDDRLCCEISGNNVDGFIITEWRRSDA